MGQEKAEEARGEEEKWKDLEIEIAFWACPNLTEANILHLI